MKVPRRIPSLRGWQFCKFKTLYLHVRVKGRYQPSLQNPRWISLRRGFCFCYRRYTLRRVISEQTALQRNKVPDSRSPGLKKGKLYSRTGDDLIHRWTPHQKVSNRGFELNSNPAAQRRDPIGSSRPKFAVAHNTGAV